MPPPPQRKPAVPRRPSGPKEQAAPLPRDPQRPAAQHGPCGAVPPRERRGAGRRARRRGGGPRRAEQIPPEPVREAAGAVPGDRSEEGARFSGAEYEGTAEAGAAGAAAAAGTAAGTTAAARAAGEPADGTGEGNAADGQRLHARFCRDAIISAGCVCWLAKAICIEELGGRERGGESRGEGDEGSRDRWCWAGVLDARSVRGSRPAACSRLRPTVALSGVQNLFLSSFWIFFFLFLGLVDLCVCCARVCVCSRLDWWYLLFCSPKRKRGRSAC